MKKMTLVIPLALSAVGAFAQVDAKYDYGHLVPDNRFTITHESTDFKNRADVTSFVHEAKDKGELITYKVKDVKSPGKKEFKVSILRDNGKLSRITAVDFSSNGAMGVHGVKSSSLNQDGYVTSNTHCYDEYQLGLFNNKIDEKSFKCSTVNRAVCDYIEENKVAGELMEQVNACSDLLKRFAEHQKNLQPLLKEDHKKNMDAMEDLNGNLSKVKNFHEVEPKTLSDVSDLVLGYRDAINNCNFLKENELLVPKSGHEPDKKRRKKKHSGDAE